MIRAAVAVSLLLAGCSSDAIRTSQQAMAIALASDCAKADVPLVPGEKMPTAWSARRIDEKWHVWLPPDQDGPDKADGAWLKGAWIDARNGQVDHCEVRLFGPGPKSLQTGR